MTTSTEAVALKALPLTAEHYAIAEQVIGEWCVSGKKRSTRFLVAQGVARAMDRRAPDPIREEMAKALEEIAKQELSPDMSVDQQLDGDFEGAYNHLIETARAALAKHKRQAGPEVSK